MKKKPTSWRCKTVQQQKDKNTIYQSREWKELRIQKYRANPLCEMCKAEGKDVSAHAIHHRIPIETATTMEEMKRLAFDWNNLVSLCWYHHAKVHQEMGSTTKEVVAQRAEARQQRWKSSILARFTLSDAEEQPENPAPSV